MLQTRALFYLPIASCYTFTSTPTQNYVEWIKDRTCSTLVLSSIIIAGLWIISWPNTTLPITQVIQVGYLMYWEIFRQNCHFGLNHTVSLVFHLLCVDTSVCSSILKVIMAAFSKHPAL